MQTKDHLALGRYLAHAFAIEEPVKKYAFVIGNIMPDVNKCSYIHGYFWLLRAHRRQKNAGSLSANDHRRMLIGGHTAEGSCFFVNRMYRVLRNRKNLSVLDYYRLGKRYIIWRIALLTHIQCGIWMDFSPISGMRSGCISVCGRCCARFRMSGKQSLRALQKQVSAVCTGHTEPPLPK